MAEALRASKKSERSALDALPRVAARSAPSPADFGALVKADTPVIIKGLFDRWPALAVGRQGPSHLSAYLKGMDRGIPVPVMEAPARSGGRFAYASDIREFTYTKRSGGLAETLDRIERLMDQDNAAFVAIQMLPLASHMPDFIRQNPMPLPVGQDTPRLWIGGAVSTQTRNDREHNLACVIAGRRRFVLFPPDQVGNLYIGPRDTPPALSLVDPEAPDFERFPRFREAMAAARVAYLEPGDAIFMPKYWWHHVTSLDRYNAMVNYWWGGDAAGLDSANDLFLAALLTLKDLPPSERAHWREMFDTYVFGSGGDALDHIPRELQGPLGEMSPATRAVLKRELRNVFTKMP